MRKHIWYEMENDQATDRHQRETIKRFRPCFLFNPHSEQQGSKRETENRGQQQYEIQIHDRGLALRTAGRKDRAQVTPLADSLASFEL